MERSVVCGIQLGMCVNLVDTSQNTQYLVDQLREVQTLAIIFLKSMSESMSERDGSDKERLCNRMMNFWIDSKSIEDDVIQIQSRSMSDPTSSDIDFKHKMALV